MGIFTGGARQAARQSSGRVIATSRALLAAFFTLAVVLDPTQTGEQTRPILLLLSVYTLVACVVLALTWNNWWMEVRLASPAHATDLLLFAVLVSLTEGYISPFFTFYVFLILSSTIRGRWREAFVTMGLVVLLYLAAAIVSASGSLGSAGLEIQRFVLRGAHLLVVSFMIIWFGLSQREFNQRRAAGLGDDPLALAGPPIDEVLQHAARRLKAAGVVLAWSEAEEPWLRVASLVRGEFTQEKFGPEEYPDVVIESMGDRPFLFDMDRSRALSLPAGSTLKALRGTSALSPIFATRFGIEDGLAIPFRADTHEGHLFAIGVPGLSSDDLRQADFIGQEIAAAFDRAALFAATREAATTRVRSLLARDLHDSAVQCLAGLSLRVEGLRKSAADVPELVREVEDLQQQLSQEQRDLRELVSALRNSRRVEHRPLSNKLVELGTRLEKQWGVECRVNLDSTLAPVPARLHHDVEQLVREAVANAVKHGEARLIFVAAWVANSELRLSIRDDGRGFPVWGGLGDAELSGDLVAPRSLYERVHLLSGAMQVRSSPRGSELSIVLPVEELGA